jgi:hypothetical protein
MPLPLDDAGMEVLEWLEDASFEWDMCVDHPLLLSHLSRRDGI